MLKVRVSLGKLQNRNMKYNEVFTNFIPIASDSKNYTYLLNIYYHLFPNY